MAGKGMGEGDGGVVEAAEPRDLKIKLRSAQRTFSQFSQFLEDKNVTPGSRSTARARPRPPSSRMG